MDINASIVDQRIIGIAEELSSELEEIIGNDDPVRKKSLAFVLLCVSTVLDTPLTEALELLTEGGNDLGVDALHLSEVDDGEFTVTLFQGKYTHKNLNGDTNFPENSIKSLISLVSNIFDPNKQFTMNPRLAPRIEEVRSLIRDGYIPNVRLLFCSNGQRWNNQAQQWLDNSGLNHSQVHWEHYNHNDIVAVLQRSKAVNDSIQLTGEAIIEDFNFRRVLVGKVPVTEIAKLFDRNGDLLLERNIRRYLGRNTNRINNAIHDTLVSPEKQKDFYFFNNGITMTCTKMRHNALQGSDYQLKLENIQIINGGQTCKTIQQTINEANDAHSFNEVYVLLRLYELESDDDQLINEITFATNSQNPVDLRDLRSNDSLQIQLETGINSLGYIYRRYREESTTSSRIITSATTAEAVMAIWRKSPHQSKFRRRELFGALYEKVFTNLSPAQAILAVLIFRAVENERKRPTLLQPTPDFLPYAAHYMAMLVGQLLLSQAQIRLQDINHKNLEELIHHLEQNTAELITEAALQLQKALTEIYGERQVSLQQLSATFRRGDLLEFLPR
ncbi:MULTISPECIES: AIPR family protein [Oligella]|uniref:Abortive phage resistance protein n=2 Tax=Oligella urethralis TaxID=90245 RepID=A0A096B4I1_9BURK|nr:MULTISPECIES: AIPR family protein [Oligella]KGF28194.1 abortive phage resistance protein [Oligella urethralis DNF00040]OFV50253.1 abortive phage resistance protein [Oligella sp. HMSC09E12]SPY08756.1 AIPR protein [Oligella urethralis]SUA66415.1 AIPR protein [Oligella urethralis]